MIKFKKIIKRKRIELCDLDDEGLVDNFVRLYKTNSEYRIESEGKCFGIFPLSPIGFKNSLICFNETFILKQKEFDNLFLNNI